MSLVFADIHHFFGCLIPKTLTRTIVEVTFAVFFDPTDINCFLAQDISAPVKYVLIVVDDMRTSRHFSVIEYVVFIVNPFFTRDFAVGLEVVPVSANFCPVVLRVRSIFFEIVRRTSRLVVLHFVFRHTSITFYKVRADPFIFGYVATVFEVVPFTVDFFPLFAQVVAIFVKVERTIVRWVINELACGHRSVRFDVVRANPFARIHFPIFAEVIPFAIDFFPLITNIFARYIKIISRLVLAVVNEFALGHIAATF